jgi:hypothetical protein
LACTQWLQPSLLQTIAFVIFLFSFINIGVVRGIGVPNYSNAGKGHQP